ANDGSFEIRHVPRGRYQVQLVNELGDVLDHTTADANPNNIVPVLLTLRAPLQPKASGETVSVARLRHTPARKAMQAVVAAQQYPARGDLAIATDDLRKAVRLDPEFAEAHANLGVALIRSGHPDEAEKEFRRAVELDGTTSAHQSNLAFVLMALGKL